MFEVEKVNAVALRTRQRRLRVTNRNTILILMNQETAIIVGVVFLTAAYLGYRLFSFFRARGPYSGEGKNPAKKKRQPCTRCGDRCVHCARSWFN
jgi:hypothetical protein